MFAYADSLCTYVYARCFMLVFQPPSTETLRALPAIAINIKCIIKYLKTSERARGCIFMPDCVASVRHLILYMVCNNYTHIFIKHTCTIYSMYRPRAFKRGNVRGCDRPSRPAEERSSIASRACAVRFGACAYPHRKHTDAAAAAAAAAGEGIHVCAVCRAHA